ncbi:aminopeptidase [Heyndrickxia sporothermodurans]|nr:aminopeptidase [Heyndrickxia sporothermodurans]
MQSSLFEENRCFRLFWTVVISILGGTIFVFIHLPIPWLLGPMTAVFIASRVGRIKPYWPVELRNVGLVIVGYTIGLSFTKDALVKIIHQLPSMLLMTVMLILFNALFAMIIAKFTGVDYPTVLTGCIPGGLSQIITLGEEIKGIDLTIVTLLQVTRLMMIIFIVPFLVMSPLVSGGDSFDFTSKSGNIGSNWGELFPNILLFAIISVLFAYLGKKVKLPTPYLLGPVIATVLLNLNGFHGASLPPFITDISQFLMGAYIGLLMKPDQLKNKLKIISYSIFSGLILILGSLGLTLLLVKFHHFSPATGFLSAAPGGMDQMGIIAHEVHADLSIVTGYQLFRIFFIYFIVPPFLKWFFAFHERRKLKSSEIKS